MESAFRSRKRVRQSLSSYGIAPRFFSPPLCLRLRNAE